MTESSQAVSASHWTDHFPGNFQWSNAMLVCKGMAPYGAVALDEIERIGADLHARAGEPNAWKNAWCAMASALEQRADAAAARGHEKSAGNLYLRAGNYFYTGERFIPPGPEKAALGERAYRCYHAGLRRRYPELEFVEVPYEGVSLPALFMKSAEAARRAPTVVVFNGMDNCKEMSVLFAGIEFAARGMHTLAIDGPGQGESLRLRGIHSRYDYEAAGAAAYHYVASREDVDGSRVFVMGYSFGGYYATRIAGFEKRYAGGIALTAPHWDLAAFQISVREKAQAAGRSLAQSNFQFRWVVGARDDDEAIEIARKFTVADVAPQISCPFLVTHGEKDRIIPVANARKLYDAVGSRKKVLKIFSAEEGGAEHAHVDNRQVGIDFAADWMADVLGER